MSDSRFDDIQPIFITAPTVRNGITLLQRLLNSTGDIIIYGENAHLVETLPATVFQCLGIHLNHEEPAKRAREKFLNESTEFWSSSLWPDTKGYVDLMATCFRQFITYYQECSERYGFKRWGIKHPCTNIKALDRFLTLLPNGRFVYVYRNLYDVTRSAKARQFLRCEADLENLARTWCESVTAVVKQQLPNLLVIRYESLIGHPELWIARIERFAGVLHIDPNVMEKKINTFQGHTENGHAPGEYIEPQPLTREDCAILERIAGDDLERLGYPLQRALGGEAAAST